MLFKFNIGTLDIDIQLCWLIKSKKPVSFMLPFAAQLYGDFQKWGCPSAQLPQNSEPRIAPDECSRRVW